MKLIKLSDELELFKNEEGFWSTLEKGLIVEYEWIPITSDELDTIISAVKKDCAMRVSALLTGWPSKELENLVCDMRDGK